MSTVKKFGLQEIVAHCKEYGFVYPSSDIYGGLNAVYDYGPYGSQLRQNIKDYWWRAMVQAHENIVGLDASIFMHPQTWVASGHVDAFNDPMIDNKDSKKRYRADHLIEEVYAGKLENKIAKEIRKAAKRFGDAFNEQEFRATNPRVLKYQGQIDSAIERMNAFLNAEDLAGFKGLIEELEIKCPVSGTGNWTDIRQFNLMFSTQGGGSLGDNNLYLRPETAQGIFVNFNNVLNSSRQKLPFGIAQIGKAFRNEIVARQFVFRMREFEQMEMQYFVRPGKELAAYEYWKEKRLRWHQAIIGGEKAHRFHNHEKLAHYANAAADIEFEYAFGFRELEGIHSRTDFDLKAHQELSGKKLQYFDPELKESYVPYVVETSVGCDRMFLAVLSDALQEDIVPDADGKESSRTVMKLHPALAPVKCTILPLLKNKEALTSKAREVFDRLKYSFQCQYDEKDAIGRRYRRQDAIGTPYCVTIDFDTLEDNTVTIRDRDTLEQKRVSIDEVERIISEKVDIAQLLRQL
ncbi:glycyl-tRNA synthetase, dimeric type [Saprospira grandis DSM 2844]|uniref:Glycine--tRNA ligase n=1 Tax=Saprospira grandis DSM 2844 TaxID=694433 RepID=J1I303_9BACT|nr:glycine--tRNA ligase [Saprospira grandis]EJF53090.1 glycyl-tRNA synthetase, dimeric type [Saprospira grandis DSM 2844]